MADLRETVSGAIERWRSKGLIDEATSRALIAETREHARGQARSRTRYVIAAVAAVLVVIAAARFVDQVFPLLTLEWRTIITAAAGLVLHAVGVRIGVGERVKAVGVLMQLGGMWILLVAGFTSEEIWAAGTVEGVLVGVSALAVAIASGPVSLRQGEFVPGLTLPFSFIFLWLFLDRARGLEAATGLWVLDAVMLGVLVLLGRRLVRSPKGKGERWVLFAISTAAFATFVLITLTAAELDAGDAIFYPLDLWWAILVGLCWTGWRRRVAGFESWYEAQLTLLVLVGTGLTWATLGGSLGMDESVYSIWAGLGAALVLVLALRVESILILVAAALCLTVNSWIWAVTAEEAGSVVVALLLSGALLFCVATRIGASRKPQDRPVDEGGEAR